MISAENAEKCRVFFYVTFLFFEAPKNNLYKHAYKNAEIRHNYEFIRAALYLFFFFTQSWLVPIVMRSACRFLYATFFSLKQRRICASYKYAYENAEIRQKCQFLKAFVISLPDSRKYRKWRKVPVFYATFFEELKNKRLIYKMLKL